MARIEDEEDEVQFARCPDCGKKVRVKVPGKKLLCPKCEILFYPDEDEEEEIEDDRPRKKRRYEDENEEDEDEDERPIKKRRDLDDEDEDDEDDRPRKKKRRDEDNDDRPRKKKKKKGGNKTLILWVSIGAGALVVITLVVVLIIIFSGSSHESLIKEGLVLTNELAGVLENVKDANSAKAAVPKLESIGKRLESLQKRRKGLGDPKPEEEKRLKEKYEPEGKKLIERMMKIELEIAKKKIAEPTFLKALEKLNKMGP